MKSVYYVGLDVHKKTISYCVKRAGGELMDRGTVAATRPALDAWAEQLPAPWQGAMEATLFSAWIYDHLEPLADDLAVAHPAMLEAITRAKKKNDQADAEKICDLLRCDLLPRCWTAPAWIRDLRRVLRYRNLLVRQSVRMQNLSSGLLMEYGEEHLKSKLHGKRYFYELLDSLEHTPESAIELLALSRGMYEMFVELETSLRRGLVRHPLLAQRVALLRTIDGVGEVTALTWALEVGEVERFSSVGRAVSYCGLSARQDESAGKSKRGPLSKQRNKHLQTMLIEASKLAPRYNAQLKAVHEKALATGSRNRATVAVARKLVAYLLAVDRSKRPFAMRAKAA